MTHKNNKNSNKSNNRKYTNKEEDRLSRGIISVKDYNRDSRLGRILDFPHRQLLI